MRITRVVFFVEVPLTVQDSERFGLEAFRRRGFQVEVWDFSALLHAQIVRSMVVVDPGEFAGLRKFASWPEAHDACKELSSSCCVVNLVGYRLHSWRVYRLLSRMGVPHAVQANNMLPTPRASHALKVLRRLTKPSVSGALASMFARIPCRWIGVRPPTLLLTGGAWSVETKQPVAVGGEVLSAHAFDYDIFLRERVLPGEPDEKRGVFLDEFIPFHMDWRLRSMQPPITAEEYYPLLCRFFDVLERRHGMHIVIAAHPRSYYERLPDLFEGRPVIRGETSRLTRNSGFAIAHCSVSVNFPVLYRRPVIFVTTEKLDAHFEGPYIARMAEVLGKRPIRIDGELPEDLGKEWLVDQRAYAEYQHAYIKANGSPELPFWEIVADRLEQGIARSS